MTTYVFDIETDGFLDTMSTIHCLVIKDVEAGTVSDFADAKYGAGSVEAGVRLLMQGDVIAGHNVIKFDVPAIQKLYPWFKPALVRDTMVLTRLLWADVAEKDSLRKKRGQFPGKLVGAHSLEAWGYRLGILKGTYAQDTKGDPTSDAWASWSQEMHDYCIQDVEVTAALWERIWKKNPDPRSVTLEHEFATIIAMQERNGFAFNRTEAAALYADLVKERLALTEDLKRTFQPERIETEFVPKVNNKKMGYVKGEPFTKVTFIEFNPSSRQQIARRLKALGWQPEEFTPSGEPKVDETVLESLPYPEAKLLARYFLVEKRIGQIAEGDQAWLKKVTAKGRIHGGVNTNGAVTGRCTHSNPNIAQVPKVGTPYGKECRALFSAGRGLKLVGIDLSGLELRCLAHFMARYDGGAYAKVLLEGDIHTVNQKAAGLPTRDNAKTFIYAFLYGAGDQKIGSIVAPSASPMEQRRIGKRLKASFLAKTPALKALREAVQQKVEKSGELRGLDGRVLRIRSSHAALNTLLQSAGALIAKQATIHAYENLSTRGWVFGKDWALVAHIHDELQIEAKPEIAEEVGRIVVQSMKQAGEFFSFRVPIDGEFKIGTTWADTH